MSQRLRHGGVERHPARLPGALQGLAGSCGPPPVAGHWQGRRPPTVEESALELAACLAEGDTPHRQLEARELGETLSRFLFLQKPEVRTAFLRRYWYAESLEEVAAYMGWGLSRTKSVLFRTRKRLEIYLKQEGY